MFPPCDFFGTMGRPSKGARSLPHKLQMRGGFSIPRGRGRGGAVMRTRRRSVPDCRIRFTARPNCPDAARRRMRISPCTACSRWRLAFPRAMRRQTVLLHGCADVLRPVWRAVGLRPHPARTPHKKGSQHPTAIDLNMALAAGYPGTKPRSPLREAVSFEVQQRSG